MNEIHTPSAPLSVLVYPSGTASAQEIQDALKYCKQIRLFGGPDPSLPGDCVFRNCIEDLPSPDAPDLAEQLNRCIDRHGIGFIFPADDRTLKRLSEMRAELHAVVAAASAETVEICLSGRKTFASLSDTENAVSGGAGFLPVIWSAPDTVPVDAYPVFVSPDSRCSGIPSGKIADRSHLEEALAAEESCCICEYLPGAEFTVDCFTDRHGALKVIRPRTRERIRAGLAVRSRTLEADEKISAIAEEINRRIAFRGAWFFRLKCNAAGEYRLLRVSPRIAGSMGLTRAAGINLPLLTLRLFAGLPDPPAADYAGSGVQLLMDRAFASRFRTDITYDRVYVDFDDTLVLNGKVNPVLMQFLYQARNQGKELVLLTRHAADIHADLAAFRIPETLFTKIVSMDRTESKGEHVEPNSVFIDDSFAERKRVLEEKGIPVFDLDMVESLMDPRN